MEKNLHNESFDKLLRSKYRNEKVQPEAYLWKNIQSQLPSAPLPVKSWHLSKVIYIGGSIIAALGIAAVLIYYFSLKPDSVSSSRLHSDETILIKQPVREKRTKNNNLLIKTTQQADKPAATKPLLGKESEKRFQLQRSGHLSLIKENTKNHLTKNSIQQHNLRKKNTTTTSGLVPIVSHITSMQSLGFPRPKITQPMSTKWHASMLKHKLTVYQAVKKENKKKKRKKKKTYIQHPWSLEIYWRPEYSYRTLASNPSYTKDVFTTSYFDKRDQYKFTYSYGLLFDYRFLPKFSIESGLAYYSYELGFSTPGTDLIKKDNHNALVYTSLGTVALNIENVDSLNTKTILSSSIGIHYMSLPINLKFYPANNLFINVGTTIDYNFSQTLNWEEENENGNFNVESGEISGINRFNISVILGLGYEQQILRNMSFSINPGIRIHLINLNRHSTVKSFPYHAGFRLCLQYKF